MASLYSNGTDTSDPSIYKKPYVYSLALDENEKFLNPERQRKEEGRTGNLENGDGLMNNEDTESSDDGDAGLVLMWRKGLNAEGSTWSIRVSLLISSDLLVVGANDEANDPCELYVCDLKTMQWSGAELNGKGPSESPFYQCCTSRMKEKMFIIYPYSCTGKPGKILYSYSSPQLGELTVKSGEAIVITDDTNPLWVVGETLNGAKGKIPRTCVAYEKETKTISRLDVQMLSFVDDMHWTLIRYDGYTPLMRTDFTCTAHEDFAYFIGGFCDDGSATESISRFDMVRFTWSKCDVSSTNPIKPRAGHSCTLVGDDLYVFGGTNGNDYFNDLAFYSIRTNQWIQIQTYGSIPPERAYHSMTLYKNYLILFGGRNNDRVFDDLYVMNLDTFVWIKYDSQGDAPKGRFGHFAGCFDSCIVIFGGKNLEVKSFDIYFIDIVPLISKSIEKSIESKKGETQSTNHLNQPEGDSKPPSELINEESKIEVPTVLSTSFSLSKSQEEKELEIESANVDKWNENRLIEEKKEVEKTFGDITELMKENIDQNNSSDFESKIDEIDLDGLKRDDNFALNVNLSGHVFSNMDMPVVGGIDRAPGNDEVMNVFQVPEGSNVMVRKRGEIRKRQSKHSPISMSSPTSLQRIEELFKNLGISKTKNTPNFKKNIPNHSTKTPRREKSLKRRLNENVLKDKGKLKDELQRIFMYYCSFGDHLNLDLMSSSKFAKFIRDIQVSKFVRNEEIDIIFVKLMKCKNKRNEMIGLEDRQQKMSFPYFIESLKVVASKVYPDLPSTKALVELLLNYVLCNAKKFSETLTNVDIFDAATQKLFKQQSKILQALFYVYTTPESPDEVSHEYLSINQFLKFCTDFEIIPELITKKDLYIIFRSAIVDSVYEDVAFEEFEECLIKCASLAYSKHPYNYKYPLLCDKLNALFERMGVPDWEKIRKKLQKIGYRDVPNTLNYARIGNSVLSSNNSRISSKG